ncbi:eukaryotic translation initiation factor gamma [Xylaria bambusicola]|uniref:eukaryotic translation initiation factor gamma n=1 Tax=Xylaria bambusicola TaxID=326684 RepID=UPI002007ED36|nr:eukaryotic translation initiation factor gamma [Xylaria bambusicola]KAI0503183.1 eukaryotic translation initiation factor gamma [Xylaria bambusicola]
MHSLVQPNAWAALRLPSGNLRVLQVTPNTTISLGKYGSFPTNLIIERPYHLTYELLDKRPDEGFNRLRIVPPAELYADIFSSDTNTPTSEDATPAPDAEGADNALPTDVEYSLVDSDSGAVVAITDRAEIAAEARQTLTLKEIEALKKDGTDAGRELIAKLMLSHTAIDQKTEYSLAKYKLLKTRKYIRRFSILPLDIPLLNHWTLEDKDPSKILDMREEMVALVGCWANVHFGGEDPSKAAQPSVKIKPEEGEEEEEEAMEIGEEAAEITDTSVPGRWLVIDDTGGFLVAAMAERMGILYPLEADSTNTEDQQQKTKPSHIDSFSGNQPTLKEGEGATESHAKKSENVQEKPEPEEGTKPSSPQTTRKRPRREDTIPYAHANTITHIHANAQPNLSFLRYYGFDMINPFHTPSHPLASHLTALSWLQLLEPSLDAVYSSPEPSATPEEIYSWKTNRRSTFHRKRKRWLRTRHIIDSTRKGGFTGLVVASTMDPISIMRACVPLLAGGALIAIYSPTIEPLTELADCYSLGRRAAWASNPPPSLLSKPTSEQENFPGNEDFPLNPSLILGASIQTSRVRKWQVLPGRTHPVMTSRGGAEGYVFTATRVVPAEGKVEARGNIRSRKSRKVESEGQDKGESEGAE